MSVLFPARICHASATFPRNPRKLVLFFVTGEFPVARAPSNIARISGIPSAKRGPGSVVHGTRLPRLSKLWRASNKT
jgi:hypothetical protein